MSDKKRELIGAVIILVIIGTLSLWGTGAPDEFNSIKDLQPLQPYEIDKFKKDVDELEDLDGEVILINSEVVNADTDEITLKKKLVNSEQYTFIKIPKDTPKELKEKISKLNKCSKA